MSFSMETEKENKLPLLDVEIIREQGKLTTSIYRNPTFRGVYSNFESFLPSVYKLGMVYTLVYRCFQMIPEFEPPFSVGGKLDFGLCNTNINPLCTSRS